jgi:VPDSG-CTERM motif
MIGTLDAFSGVIMKINGVLTGKVILLLGIGCAVLMASAKDANAYPVSLPPGISLTIGDQHELGLVQRNIPNGNGARRNYVNHLIGMALGTHDVAFGNGFFRSNNSFNPLPQAVLAGLVSGTSTTINLGSGLYTYLFANYSGQQREGVGSSFAEVWYVGNLSGVITIPGAGLSEWMLFGRGSAGAVPDGGTTVMLLGAALGVLGVARRFLID